MAITLNIDLVDDPRTKRSIIDLSYAIYKCTKIVVITGAGISSSSGIPDFRSSDGLYAIVREQYPGAVVNGRDIFDASLFRDPESTAIFYSFISRLKTLVDAALPTPTHHFIKTLDTGNKLLRSYTQNIDNLEGKVGLLSTSFSLWEEPLPGNRDESRPERIVHVQESVRNIQLHGNIQRVRCQTCGADYPFTAEHMKQFGRGSAPQCPECAERVEARRARASRPVRTGVLRPSIVLFGETHPFGDDIEAIRISDIARKPDMLIIMGTSLKVHGIKRLVKGFAKAVHDHVHSATRPSSRSESYRGKVIFVNKTAPSSEWSHIIDYHVASETDVWVERVLQDWQQISSNI